MVGPLILSRPMRVFARLPFTGDSRTSPAICCDLSRTASIIPAHPLPRNLVVDSVPKDKMLLQQTFDEPSPEKAKNPVDVAAYNLLYGTALNSNTSADVATNVDTSVAAVNTAAAAAGPQSNCDQRGTKRLNCDSDQSVAKILKRDSMERKCLNHFNGEKKVGNHIGKVVVSSLLAENEQLKQQNEILRRKLLTFQMILQKEESYVMAVKKVKALQTRHAAAVVSSR